MTETFTKLFSSITESTIWQEPAETRIVWITMLAMADRNGHVHSSIPGLASRAKVPLEATEAALNRFMAPDKYSRTKDHEGRRIKEIDRGWLLLNHAKYREMRDEESRREYNAEWMRRKRQQSKESGDEKSTVDSVDSSGSKLAQAEAYTEAYTEAEEKKDQKRPPTVDVSRPGDQLFDFGLQYLISNNVKEKAARSFLGLLRKKVGEIEAVRLLVDADKQQVSDPVAWLTAASQSKKGKSAATASFADKTYVGTPEARIAKLL